MKSQEVELHPAFVWDCPSCGREQFERSVVAELSPDELEELREQHGIQPWEAGRFHTKPTTVNCRSCGFSGSTADEDQCIQDEDGGYA